MNKVYQLEYNGPRMRLIASSHTPSELDRAFTLDNENFDIQGLGKVAKYLNSGGEEIVSIMRSGYGSTENDQRYVIVTRVVQAAKRLYDSCELESPH